MSSVATICFPAAAGSSCSTERSIRDHLDGGISLVRGADGRRLAKRHGDTRLDHHIVMRACSHRGSSDCWPGGAGHSARHPLVAEFLDVFDVDKLPSNDVIFSEEDDMAHHMKALILLAIPIAAGCSPPTTPGETTLSLEARSTLELAVTPEDPDWPDASKLDSPRHRHDLHIPRQSRSFLLDGLLPHGH